MTKKNMMINLFNCCCRIDDILIEKEEWTIQEQNIIDDCGCVTGDMLPMRIHVLSYKEKDADYSSMELEELYRELNNLCDSFLEKESHFKTKDEKKMLSDIRDLKADLSSLIPEPLIISVNKSSFGLILSGKKKSLRIKSNLYLEERLKRSGVCIQTTDFSETGMEWNFSVSPVIFQKSQGTDKPQIHAKAYIAEDASQSEVNDARYYIVHITNIQKGDVT